MLKGKRFWLVISECKRATAVCPISIIGWAMVVNRGTEKEESSMLSKPMTEMSFGTFRL